MVTSCTSVNAVVFIELCFRIQTEYIIKWYWSSSDFPFKSLLHGKFQIPKDTVIGEYFQSKEIPKTTEQVWACDWFNYVRDNDADRTLYEHCVPYKNKAISFIWED